MACAILILRFPELQRIRFNEAITKSRRVSPIAAVILIKLLLGKNNSGI